MRCDENTPLSNGFVAGFTLVELVMVIALTGVVAVMTSTIFTSQFYGYQQMSQRADLVQNADTALFIMSSDINNAVPNSIRVSGNYLEIVPIYQAAIYRHEHSGSASSDTLDMSIADSSFDVFNDLVSVDTVLSGAQVVIYNLGLYNAGVPILGANLYAANTGTDPHVISPAGLTIVNNGSEDTIELDTAHQFSQDSPLHKLYLVAGALTYHCDTAAEKITRYEGYSIQVSQPTNAGTAPLTPATSSVLIDNVTACSFDYATGAQTRNAVVTLSLTLTEAGESVNLINQVQVNNVP